MQHGLIFLKLIYKSCKTKSSSKRQCANTWPGFSFHSDWRHSDIKTNNTGIFQSLSTGLQNATLHQITNFFLRTCKTQPQNNLEPQFNKYSQILPLKFNISMIYHLKGPVANSRVMTPTNCKSTETGIQRGTQKHLIFHPLLGVIQEFSKQRMTYVTIIKNLTAYQISLFITKCAPNDQSHTTPFFHDIHTQTCSGFF